jgi:hypothetical protein
MFEALGTDLIVYIGSYIGLSLCDLLCRFSIVSKHFNELSQKWIPFLPSDICKSGKHVEWIISRANSIKRLHSGDKF